ncbi:MAG: ferritin-like domain-containing protein [Pseudomonadaceae bacterium]|nr:ferritin-like domain-containing protein [Pseudomonadaceae bacterium]
MVDVTDTTPEGADDDHEMPREYSSSPCYQHELEQELSVYMSDQEIVALLNELLEGERAGAQGLNDMCKDCDEPKLAELLLLVAKDEGRYCVMLGKHIRKLGESPSSATGVFYEKLQSRESLVAKLEFLNRGQSAVVRSLEEAIPNISDIELRRELEEMRDTHITNIEHCAQYLHTRVK